MKQTCWVLALLFAVLAGGLAYQFLWRGAVVPASDGRAAIQLEPGERDLVLGEMRAFLVATQQILTIANRGTTEGIARAARAVGVAAQHDVPPSLMGKLPGEFKLLGFDTHSRFDQLALDAEQIDDPSHSLQQLAELLSNCIACHGAYRIDTPTR
jgi:hypothetical protein